MSHSVVAIVVPYVLCKTTGTYSTTEAKESGYYYRSTVLPYSSTSYTLRITFVKVDVHMFTHQEARFKSDTTRHIEHLTGGSLSSLKGYTQHTELFIHARHIDIEHRAIYDQKSLSFLKNQADKTKK